MEDLGNSEENNTEMETIRPKIPLGLFCYILEK
jgi:hypothetical protein